MKIIIILFSLILAQGIWGQNNSRQKNVVIKYKQYESFDLGNLEIEGKIIAPGDISIKDRQRRRFKRSLYIKSHFDDETTKDFENLR